LAIIAGRLNRSYQTRAPNFKPKTLRANCWPNQSTQTPVALREYRYQEQGDYLSRLNMFSSDGYESNFDRPAPVARMALADEIIVTAQKRQVEQEDFGDYKLYRVSEPVTVNSYQTKQVRFLDIDEAQYKKIYTLDVSLNPNYANGVRGLDATSIEYRLNNDLYPKALCACLLRMTAGTGW